MFKLQEKFKFQDSTNRCPPLWSFADGEFFGIWRLGFGIFAASACLGASSSEEGFVSLFDGRTLDGWAARPKDPVWSVVDGVIDCKGSRDPEAFTTYHLYTKNWYRDFVFRFEFRFSGEIHDASHGLYGPDGSRTTDYGRQPASEKSKTAGDSGLILRAFYKAQVNLWCNPMGSGEIQGYHRDPSLPLDVRVGAWPVKKADRPLGEWNAMEITLVGEVVTIVLNGETVIKNARLPDMPHGGPIGLQHHRFGTAKGQQLWTPIQFRNLRIKEL